MRFDLIQIVCVCAFFAIALSGKLDSVSFFLLFLFNFIAAVAVVVAKLKTCPFGVPSKIEISNRITCRFFFLHPSNHSIDAAPYANSCCLYNKNVYLFVQYHYNIVCLYTMCMYIYSKIHQFYTPKMGRAQSRFSTEFYEFTFGNFPKLNFISIFQYIILIFFV